MNIVNGNLMHSGLRTIVEAAESFAPATIGANILESVSENEIVQTAAKTVQCMTTAVMGVWATWNILDFSKKANLKYWGIINYTATVVAAVTLSIPALCYAAKYLSPENRGEIEDFQQFYATTIKIINIIAAGIALVWFSSLAFTSWELSHVFTPLVLSAASFISSAYTLNKDIEVPVITTRKV